MFHGTMTALVTPFVDGAIDEDAFRAHLERQVEAGVNGVVPAGTTGEAATLSFSEHREVIRIAVEQVAGRVPVIAGTGSNNTAESIELTRAARSLGADAALLISPYYNKPTQEGIYCHYAAVAEAVHMPQIIYNVPGRTQSNIEPATVGRLSQIANIVGIKDATADMAYLAHCVAASEGRIEFYSGDDATVMPFMAMGGHGVISVISNVTPRSMSALTDAMYNGDHMSGRRIQLAMRELNRMLFIQANPIPVKSACAMLGWMRDELRLPLLAMQGEPREALRQAMADFSCELSGGVESLELADR